MLENKPVVVIRGSRDLGHLVADALAETSGLVVVFEEQLELELEPAEEKVLKYDEWEGYGDLLAINPSFVLRNTAAAMEGIVILPQRPAIPGTKRYRRENR